MAQTYNTFLRGNGIDVVNVNVTPTTPGAPTFTRTKVQPPTGVSVVSDVRAMADDFEDLQVASWFGTWDQELFADTALSLTYQGNKTSNLPVALNTNLREVGVLPDGRRQWSTTNRPDPRFGNIFVSSSVGEQRYDGLVATLTKRYSHGYSVQLSYHLSKTRGTAFVNDFTGFGVFTSPSDPLNPSVDDGPSDFDMRNRFSATAVWQPEFTGLGGAAAAALNGWKFSTRVIASDGFRFNATTGQDTNGDTVFQRSPGRPGLQQLRTAGLRHGRPAPRPLHHHRRALARTHRRGLQPHESPEPDEREPHVGAEHHGQRELQHTDGRRNRAAVPARRPLLVLVEVRVLRRLVTPLLVLALGLLFMP